MMRSDTLNWYDHSGYTEMTAPSSDVNVTNEGESKRSIANEKLSQSCSTNENKSKHSIVSENLSQSCSTNKNKSKRSIVNKSLSQNCSADENELRYTKEDKPECAIKKQKDANNKVACDVTNYFNVSNIFERGRNNPGVSCERVCMATEENEYFTDIIDTLKKDQDRHGQIFPVKISKKMFSASWMRKKKKSNAT